MATGDGWSVAPYFIVDDVAATANFYRDAFGFDSDGNPTRDARAVAQDGGDIVFRGFEKGVVYLHMQGSCSGCPSSTATLKMGIENLLKHYVPEVVEVQAAQ